MSLLSEQERNQLEDDLEQQIGKNAFDAIEAAILQKLGGAKLPEPATVTVLKEIPYYTYDQLCEAYAQGAAAQLAHEPVGHFTFKGASQIWEETTKSSGTPLYTRREAK